MSARFFDLLRLIRLPNLVVVAITQCLVYYRLLRPALEQEGITPVLTPIKFIELLIVTLMITTSGYLVNDLVDTRTDAVNRPGTNPVDRLGRDLVVWFYCVAMLAGFLVTMLLAFRLQERQLVWIFPVAIGLLTLYSTSIKKIPAVGNLLVALYCAGVPGILLLAERVPMYRLYQTDPGSAVATLRIVGLFMVFAFVATLLRELVKDLEDIEGDREVGRRTLPIALGVTRSRTLALVLGATVVVAMLVPVVLGWPGFTQPTMLICLLVLIAALLFLMYRISGARGAQDYHRVSQQLKLFLLAGLALLIFFR